MTDNKDYRDSMSQIDDGIFGTSQAIPFETKDDAASLAQINPSPSLGVMSIRRKRSRARSISSDERDDLRNYNSAEEEPED
jgi:hypothetical protein